MSLENPSMFQQLKNEELDQRLPENAFIPELFSDRTLLEIAYCYWQPLSLGKAQPNLRGSKWSPDGTCCLCVVHRDGIRVMELPRDLYEKYPSPDRKVTPLSSVLRVAHGCSTYDFCWYPKMNSYIPETCSWITAIQNSPIQMWDAYDGSLRCSYRGYNSVDEMEPALSVSFISGGARIVGGYKKTLKTFDVERPGRDFVQHKISTTAACLATTDRLLAVGCWNASIKLFSISDMGTYKSTGNLHGHKGGVTHLQFTPDGSKLVSGARKDNKLLVWDIRYHRTPLNILQRCVNTNQRIYFDISPCGRYLVSGGTDGVLKIWDDEDVKWTGQFDTNSAKDKATFEFPIYEDCLSSVAIHPTLPILATGSGQYHSIDPLKILEQEDQDIVVEIDLETTCNKHTQVYNVGGILTENNTTDSRGSRQTQSIGPLILCEQENERGGNKCSSPISQLPSGISNTQFGVGIKETFTVTCETDLTIATERQAHLNNSSEILSTSNNIMDPKNKPVVEINKQDCDDEPPIKKRALEAPAGLPRSAPTIDIKRELINEFNLSTAVSIDSINVVNHNLPEEMSDKTSFVHMNIENGLTIKKELLATNTLDADIIRKNMVSVLQETPTEDNNIKESNNTELHHTQSENESNKRSTTPEKESDRKSIGIANLNEEDRRVEEDLTVSAEKRTEGLELKNYSYCVNDTIVSNKNDNVNVPGVQNCLTFWWIANIPEVHKYIK